MAGIKSPVEVGFIRPSNTLNMTSLVPAATALWGSRLSSKSCAIPTTSSPAVARSSDPCSVLPSPHPLSTMPRRLTRSTSAKSFFFMSLFPLSLPRSKVSVGLSAMTEIFGSIQFLKEPCGEGYFSNDSPQGCILHDISSNCKHFFSAIRPFLKEFLPAFASSRHLLRTLLCRWAELSSSGAPPR